MCIIADNVKDVSGTKIAIFHVGYKSNETDIVPAQLVVYSAQVDSIADQNAFILPVYNPSGNANKIIPLDMSDLPEFFSDVDKIFQKWFPTPRSKSYSMNNSFDAESSTNLLEVHEVGDYKFSIVPHKSNFNQINRSQLNINPAAKASIDVHSDNYSFIVYQFYKKGKIDITPFGYLCPTYDINSVLVPTIHGHPHDAFSPTTHISHHPTFDHTALYDHDIYALIKCLPDTKNKIILEKSDFVSLDHLLRKINTDYNNRRIQIYVPKCFMPKKIIIKNMEPNRNFLIDSTDSRFIYDLTIDTTKFQ